MRTDFDASAASPEGHVPGMQLQQQDEQSTRQAARAAPREEDDGIIYRTEPPVISFPRVFPPL